jgi:hypothetical protein
MLLERTPSHRADGRPSRQLAQQAWTAAIRQLDDREGWAPAAAALVADLGFQLIGAHFAGRQGDPGSSPLGSHLVVALRDRPTLRHFDPEELVFYGPTDAGAELRTVRRLAPGAVDHQPVSWGHVHVVDRVPVENRFLTFGGELRLEAIDASLTVAHLRSPAPIVRWGGNSQGTDGLAEAIGAFFGRLIVPVDFVSGAAHRIDTALPEVVFTAFVADAVRRLDAAARQVPEPTDLDRWLRAAWTWLRPAASWRAAAEDVLADLPS